MRNLHPALVFMLLGVNRPEFAGQMLRPPEGPGGRMR